MDISKKMKLLAEILDVDSDEITEETELRSLDEWDSLAILSFIVMMGEQFKKEVTGEQVKQLVTVADVLSMME